MTIEINKDDTPEEVDKKLNDFSAEFEKAKKERLSKFFGILEAQVDPLALQRRWRDEW